MLVDHFLAKDRRRASHSIALIYGARCHISSRSKHLAEGIAADYDADVRLAGIEILDVEDRYRWRVRQRATLPRSSSAVVIPTQIE